MLISDSSTTNQSFENKALHHIAVVVPALNEEASIGKVISEIRNTGQSEIVVVDGGSTDATRKTAEDLGAIVIKQRGMGKGAALREAFAAAEIFADVIVMMDADGSMSAAEIPRFLQEINNGADVVKGSRYLLNGGSKDISLARCFGNKFFVWLTNRLFAANFTDLCYGFKAFRSSALRRLSREITAEGFDIEAQIAIRAQRMGLKIIEVPSYESRRWEGNSHLKTIPDGFAILTRIIREHTSKIRSRMPLIQETSTALLCDACGKSPPIPYDILCSDCSQAFQNLLSKLRRTITPSQNAPSENANVSQWITRRIQTVYDSIPRTAN